MFLKTVSALWGGGGEIIIPLMNKLQWCNEQTITQKMVDHGWSDLDVVFTTIFCGTNFCIWQDMELIFTGCLQKTSQSLCT